MTSCHEKTPGLVAWAAGFFEGEGSITIQKRRRRGYSSRFAYILRVGVGQRDTKPLELLKAYWGGTYHQLGHRPSWEWFISSNQASRFLKDISPYLQFRGGLVELAFEFFNSIGKPGKWVTREKEEYREGLRNKVLELNGYFKRKKSKKQGVE